MTRKSAQMDQNQPQPPKRPNEAAEVFTSVVVGPEAYYKNTHFRGVNLSEQIAKHVVIERAVLNEVRAIGARLEFLMLTDTTLEKCDLANFQAEKSVIWRAEFNACRIVGLQLLESDLNDVLFRGCSGLLAQFFGTHFTGVRFESCKLPEADFRNCDARSVVFCDCDLTKSDFRGAKLAGADFRSSMIEGMQVGAAEIRGAIVDWSQAAYLSSLETTLGLVIG